MPGRVGPRWVTRVGRPKPPLVPSHRNLAIDGASHLDEGSQDNGGRRANQYLVRIVVRGGSRVLGRRGALVGMAAAIVLAAGGVGAAVAVQPADAPAHAPAPDETTRVVTVLDMPVTTTTTTPPPPPPAQGGASPSGSGSAT